MPLPGQLTLTVQVDAPGAVTARPHGPAGFVSTAQPVTASVASVRVPSDPTMNGGAIRSRGTPLASRISTVFATSRSPAAPAPRVSAYVICCDDGLEPNARKSSLPATTERWRTSAPELWPPG